MSEIEIYMNKEIVLRYLWNPSFFQWVAIIFVFLILVNETLDVCMITCTSIVEY